ncbi:MAG: ribose-5-phosphate isomerase RpiA [Thermoanaerobaculia bacterium]
MKGEGTMAMDFEREKLAAARRSLDYVKDGMLVGLGTGSAAAHAVRLLAERVKDGLRIRCIPTSRRTAELARSLGIPMTSFDETARLDVTIDGTDEFDPDLDLVKGGGGALLHEKIVAAASDRLVIVCESKKRVPVLGTSGMPLPVEVVPFGWPVVAAALGRMEGQPALRLSAPEEPFQTDEGNYILDCRFPDLSDAAALAERLERMTGVVEHGLFLKLASVVIMGQGDGSALFTRS